MADSFYSEFYLEFRKICNEKDINTYDAVKGIISFPSLDKWRSNKTVPKVETIILLAKKLNFPPERLESLIDRNKPRKKRGAMLSKPVKKEPIKKSTKTTIDYKICEKCKYFVKKADFTHCNIYLATKGRLKPELTSDYKSCTNRCTKKKGEK